MLPTSWCLQVPTRGAGSRGSAQPGSESGSEGDSGELLGSDDQPDGSEAKQGSGAGEEAEDGQSSDQAEDGQKSDQTDADADGDADADAAAAADADAEAAAQDAAGGRVKRGLQTAQEQEPFAKRVKQALSLPETYEDFAVRHLACQLQGLLCILLGLRMHGSSSWQPD